MTHFRTAILAQTPAAASLWTGPTNASGESIWSVPIGQYAIKSNVSELTQHRFHADGHSASLSAANLATLDTALIADLELLNTDPKAFVFLSAP